MQSKTNLLQIGIQIASKKTCSNIQKKESEQRGDLEKRLYFLISLQSHVIFTRTGQVNWEVCEKCLHVT